MELTDAEDLFISECMSANSLQPDSLLTANVTPLLLGNHNSAPKQLDLFPDTGANICLMGPMQLDHLGLTKEDLTPCVKPIRVVGGTNIVTDGKLQARIQIGENVTDQTVFINFDADRFFLSRKACMALHLIPECFPFPPQIPVKDRSRVGTSTVEGAMSAESATTITRQGPHSRPARMAFDSTAANIPELKKFLLMQFAGSTFNKNPPFPMLSTPHAKIHLKPNYIIPPPQYYPLPVADHWAPQVKASLDHDVEAGILIKVPFNEPTEWCSRMVCVKKKDGRPRRTVDFQKLNAQCVREPNTGESLFHTARRVPHHTWKSVVDAVDGYHSVAIDEESSKLTTFITPWGRYRYLRFPQGHCSAGDAFNGRIHEILKHIPRLVRIVDDVCLYDNTIEGHFWHTWDLLATCAAHGVVLNESKFQFCNQTVDFAGLSITPVGVHPSNRILTAIRDFPRPTDITKARAWFGLVNQVQWVYANGPTMDLFRDLVRPNSNFHWDDQLERLFTEAKHRIIDQVREGVRSYDTQRRTCIQTDWSKEGLGYLLLQKYRECPIKKHQFAAMMGGT